MCTVGPCQLATDSCAFCREEHGGGGLTVPLRISEPGRYKVRMGFLNESVPPQARSVHVAAEVVMGLSYGHDASAAIAADGELLLVLQVRSGLHCLLCFAAWVGIRASLVCTAKICRGGFVLAVVLVCCKQLACRWRAEPRVGLKYRHSSHNA